MFQYEGLISKTNFSDLIGVRYSDNNGAKLYYILKFL